MEVYFSERLNNKSKIFHRGQCHYGMMIKDQYKVHMDMNKALKHRFKPCTCCFGGMKGDINAYKGTITKLEEMLQDGCILYLR